MTLIVEYKQQYKQLSIRYFITSIGNYFRSNLTSSKRRVIYDQN